MAGGMGADLSQRTYRALWDLIATRTLRPGDKVTAEGLSQRFGVSRTTVKTALDQLAVEGLVLVRPQVGTFVRGLSAQDVREIWAARAMLLETGAAREGVPRATAAPAGRPAPLVAEMAPLVEGHEHREGQYRAFVELDRRFHELLVQTADNRFLLGLHRQAAVHTHAVSFVTLHARRGPAPDRRGAAGAPRRSWRPSSGATRRGPPLSWSATSSAAGTWPCRPSPGPQTSSSRPAVPPSPWWSSSLPRR